MENLLEELGYRLNLKVLAKELEEAGRTLRPSVQNWYEAAAPYFVMAYQAGREGNDLSSVFRFLEVAV